MFAKPPGKALGTDREYGVQNSSNLSVRVFLITILTLDNGGETNIQGLGSLELPD